MIVGMLRGHGMIPVGVRGASPEQKEQALALELAIMPAGRKAPAVRAAPAPTSPGQPRPPWWSISRSARGQRIYAESGDLVLVAGVSSVPR